MVIVGVDPGKSGAIVTIGETSGNFYTYPMPVIVGKRAEYDEREIEKILYQSTAPDTSLVFIERQKPLPPKMGGSLASYWRGAGEFFFHGLCTGLGLPYEIVDPTTWQKEFFGGLSKDLGKQRSVLVCKRLFPSVSLLRTERCKKDDDGIADAVLIAEYGRRKLARD